MDYDKLKQKKEQLEQAKPSIPVEKILQKQRESRCSMPTTPPPWRATP